MGHAMARGLRLVWTTNGSCHGSWVSGLLIGMQWFSWVPIAMVRGGATVRLGGAMVPPKF